mgnify:CR=1 FL=1
MAEEKSKVAENRRKSLKNHRKNQCWKLPLGRLATLGGTESGTKVKPIGLVYEEEGYANNWDGTPNVSGVSSSSQGLPSGTYYYVLEIGGVQKPLTGWLYFQR